MSRKVGAPQGRVLANGQSERSAGKCHREQTADGSRKRSQVRVKRCGKSAPVSEATRSARQTPLGARSRRRRAARSTFPGRPLRWMTIQASQGAGQNPAYRPTHHHSRPSSCFAPPVSFPRSRPLRAPLTLLVDVMDESTNATWAFATKSVRKVNEKHEKWGREA